MKIIVKFPQHSNKNIIRTLKNIFFIALIVLSNLTFAQNHSIVKGKIIDDKFNCLLGVKITNINSRVVSMSDQDGNYEIIASENDTLAFQMIGLTTEEIKIEDSSQKLNLIMMDKDVNCLGAVWTEKQYRRAHRQIEKQLKKLYKKAEKQNAWKKESC
ncbi:MAG: carboxypeptidase-like regulatory domain-containing protein [Cyclobacteriaceae bacterium]